MTTILSLHRSETEQTEPADFLAHFPSFVLQYLDDSSARDPRKAMAATRFDPAVAARKQLDGCGVYFAPNAFDGRRRLERLLQIRAVYLDLDVAKEGDGLAASAIEARKEQALVDLVLADIRPHAVIETKNGLQPLWLVRTGADIDEALKLFRRAMRALLLRFGGDPGAKDPTRLLRLPGFLHLKNPAEPFRCTLLWNELDAPPHELGSILDTYELPETTTADRPREVIPPPIQSAHAELDLAEVIVRAAAAAGIAVTFHRNADGSRQIVEDGVVTSGFLSARGNFCYSSSGKPRRGGPVQLVRYYLRLASGEARRWLDREFGLDRAVRPGKSADVSLA